MAKVETEANAFLLYPFAISDQPFPSFPPDGRRLMKALKLSKCGHVQRTTEREPESVADQPRCETLRHVRGNRRRPGSSSLVFPRRRRLGHGCQNDFGLRHGGQR